MSDDSRGGTDENRGPQTGEIWVVLVGVPGGITIARGELSTRCSGEDCGLSCSDKDEPSVTCPTSRVNEMVLCSSVVVKEYSSSCMYCMYKVLLFTL